MNQQMPVALVTGVGPGTGAGIAPPLRARWLCGRDARSQS
jgi:NAD(P)-dependent dehydrogenase (short-subunit alcohol dehydrogenase family)